jgi:hypothetical protein
MVCIPSDEAISLQFLYISIIPMYTIYDRLVEFTHRTRGGSTALVCSNWGLTRHLPNKPTVVFRLKAKSVLKVLVKIFKLIELHLLGSIRKAKIECMSLDHYQRSRSSV